MKGSLNRIKGKMRPKTFRCVECGSVFAEHFRRKLTGGRCPICNRTLNEDNRSGRNRDAKIERPGLIPSNTVLTDREGNATDEPAEKRVRPRPKRGEEREKPVQKVPKEK
jgi:predicted  nucleic acid-binding Zn-ribbon protein